MNESSIEDTKPVKVKKERVKKRPSDFDITRTILQRSSERKLSFLLKDIGEDSDLLFLCSKNEGGFTYGSPDLAIALFQWTDPELETLVTNVLSKLHGMVPKVPYGRVINIRDQISELGKTKGESIEKKVHHKHNGAIWTESTNAKGDTETVYYVQPVDSLFHFELIKYWCRHYRHLLTTDKPDYLYYPYTHPTSETGIPILFDPPPKDHPLEAYYPHGFRLLVTRGLDVITTKFLSEIPYPVISEEMIMFTDQSVSVQVAHRAKGHGWSMILLRPNAVYFPHLTTPLPNKELSPL